VVLGLLTAVALASRAGGVAALLASVATLVRWASPSLTAVAGGQAVLGPAILVGSTVTAASSWLAAAAVVAATPRRDRSPHDAVDELLVPAVAGVVAGALAAGPTVVDEPVVRIAGAIVGIAVALLLARLRYPRA
jgi:hypothetical protein